MAHESRSIYIRRPWINYVCIEPLKNVAVPLDPFNTSSSWLITILNYPLRYFIFMIAFWVINIKYSKE